MPSDQGINDAVLYHVFILRSHFVPGVWLFMHALAWITDLCPTSSAHIQSSTLFLIFWILSYLLPSDIATNVYGLSRFTTHLHTKRDDGTMQFFCKLFLKFKYNPYFNYFIYLKSLDDCKLISILE